MVVGSVSLIPLTCGCFTPYILILSRETQISGSRIDTIYYSRIPVNINTTKIESLMYVLFKSI